MVCIFQKIASFNILNYPQIETTEYVNTAYGRNDKI